MQPHRTDTESRVVERLRIERSSIHTAMTLVVVAFALVMPAAAGAAPPTLTNPSAGTTNYSEGDTITFNWSGALQGDPDAIGRSFFRVELMKSADVPSGQQATWPVNDLEAFEQTDAGEATTQMKMGAPSAGTYKWRVCAWGVEDDVANNVIEQLPNGCSASRSMTIGAAASTGSGTIGEVTKEERSTVTATPTEVVRTTTTGSTTTQQPTTTQPAVTTSTPTSEADDSSTFEDLAKRNLDLAGSAVGLGREGLGDAENSGEGLGSLARAFLSYSLPLVPIPLWSLALLGACFPMAIYWRRSVISMFDWPDGSIDGNGTMPAVLDDLENEQLAQEFKNLSIDTDTDATASTRTSSSKGRVAA